MLKSKIDEELEYYSEKKKQKFSNFISLASLLEATKVHLTFRDLKDTEEFYKSLGLEELL